jgi:hypothetical protein
MDFSNQSSWKKCEEYEVEFNILQGKTVSLIK